MDPEAASPTVKLGESQEWMYGGEKVLGESVLQDSVSVSPTTSPCILPSCTCYWHHPPMEITEIPANFMTKACVLHLLFFIKPPTNTLLMCTNE